MLIPMTTVWLCQPRVLADCRNSILAIIDDVRKQVPLARRAAVVANCSGAKWQLEGIFERIRGRSLRSDKR